MSEKKIKHLEMIEADITRMASNSFKLKSWSVTLVTGVFALSIKDNKLVYPFIAYIPVVFFWILDTYYLKLERQYRNLFDDVRERVENDIDFSMKILLKHNTKQTTFINCFFSSTEVWFYFPCAVFVTVVVALLIVLEK
ncbi:hypothetical protein [Clostridium scatologenes]|uniref:Uncharacterized protein n=1 Tax=Clostridium scatologenes TaxID=1548 RepID=A0A0E3M7V4_CLOSL|nr:hypothetical protein [Clostridium scatologenes]AKA68115.1 hypothetical protein CSCA_0990 [Clostridium scatologenes]